MHDIDNDDQFTDSQRWQVDRYRDENDLSTYKNSNRNDSSDSKPQRDYNPRYTRSQYELDKEKVTGDFERDHFDPALQIYHQNSYVDTYDPNF